MAVAVYTNKNAASSIVSMELVPKPGGNFTFFNLDKPESVAAVKQWLASPDAGQEVLAETQVNGHPVLVTRGAKNKDDIMKALAARGEELYLKVEKKPINYWAVRGLLSVAGQTLHFMSAIRGVEQLKAGDKRLSQGNAHYNPKLKPGMWVRKPFQTDIGVFAVLNQIANVMNVVFGGQKEKGDNREDAVNELVNKKLTPHLKPGEQPVGIDEDRTAVREGPKVPPSTWQKFNGFIREHSVHIAEVGLRIVGSAFVVVPGKNLRPAWNELKKGRLLKAWEVGKNPIVGYKWAGLAYLGGKLMALMAKTPDPYSKEPHTSLDTLREKYLFRASTLTEMGGALGMAHTAYTAKKIGFEDPKRPDMAPMTDWFSTVGGSLFALGFVSRLFAPFGERQVDMKEVYAHAEDMLAKTPPEKLPQLMADTAASLTEHFKDKNISYSEIYTQMMTDMYRYHHKALDDLASKPAKSPDVKEAAKPQLARPAPDQPRDVMDRVKTPADSHKDAIANAGEQQLSLGA